MRILLSILIWALVASDMFAKDLSIAPGLSIKNALVYLIGITLLTQVVLGRPLGRTVPWIQPAFAILVAYALLTWLAAALIVQYPGYSLVWNGIRLKTDLIDHVIVFLLFFYGARNLADSVFITKVLLTAVGIASAVTVGNVAGLTDIGVTEFGRDDAVEGGRVHGAFGHANETGTLIACLLPAFIAATQSSGGIRRAGWALAMVLSAVALIMTASRGAFAGLIIGGVWAAVLCRHYLSARAVLVWSALVAAVLVPILAIVGFQFGDLLFERLVSQSFGTDLGQVSSGRTEIWATAIKKMMSWPVTLLTGFGWDVYSVMAFRYTPHNHYLWLWFNLGLLGVGCFVLIIWRAVHVALLAAEAVDERVRGYIVAFVIGAMIFATAIFFANIYRPWLYFWAYAGVSLRYALASQSLTEPRQLGSPESTPSLSWPSSARRGAGRHASSAASRLDSSELRRRH